MAENKTKPTDASVEAYLATIGNEAKRKDCEAIAALMSRMTNAPAVMWGPSIVGFGSYHYRYASGREGDACLAGFSFRSGAICIYLGCDDPGQEQLLARLGPHKMSKSCLYIRKLADVDMAVLEQLIEESIAEVRRRYG